MSYLRSDDFFEKYLAYVGSLAHAVGCNYLSEP